MVISFGSPGPAPTKKTLPMVKLYVLPSVYSNNKCNKDHYFLFPVHIYIKA
jgi:hypothetical protein